MGQRWPKYGILTPESLQKFRLKQESLQAGKPKPPKSAPLAKPANDAQQPEAPKKRSAVNQAQQPKSVNKRKQQKRKSVWAIPTAIESNRRKH
jgi:hypothetical protein